MKVIRSGLFRLTARGWIRLRGPMFVNQDKAREWTVTAADAEAREGFDAVAYVWDAFSGEVLAEARARRVASFN